MIVLDTHIWVWLVSSPQMLSQKQLSEITTSQGDGLVVSVVSLWEVAKLVELGRIQINQPLSMWFTQALAYPGIVEQPLTHDIIINSTNLPSGFHRDPFDQIITATARVLNVPLMTNDLKILQYPHLKKV